MENGTGEEEMPGNPAQTGYTGKTLADTVLDKIGLRKEIISLVRDKFEKDLSDGRIMPENIEVLGETLSFVPESIRTKGLKNISWSTPEQCYAWAISNSSIVYPYPTLKSATEKLKHRLDAATVCGLRPDGIYHMPKLESIKHSSCWLLLTELIRKVNPDRIVSDVDMSPSLPDIANDEAVLKNPAIMTILVRLLELQKSPYSATVRRTDGTNVEDMIKNAVDFVALEYLLQKSGKFNNLSISAGAIFTGRRNVKSEIGSRGSKTTLVNRHIGYRLCDYLASYIPNRVSKEPEGEDFCKIFLSLIRDLYKDSEIPDNWNFPKSFFEKPSVSVRTGLRQGPSIKTKRGERKNIYIPLSFVKSAECSFYPEVTKQEMTKVGQELMNVLDKSNSFSPEKANRLVPFYKELLRLTYAASDEMRQQWRKYLYIPSTAQLRVKLAERANLIASEVDKGLQLDEFINDINTSMRSLKYECPFDTEEQKTEARAAVNASLDKRKQAKARPGRV